MSDENATKTYTVTLVKSFPSELGGRFRGGHRISVGQGQVLELTDAEAQEIKDDPMMTIDEGDTLERPEETKYEDTESGKQAAENPSGNHSNVVAGYNGPGVVPVNPDQDPALPTDDTQSTSVNQANADGSAEADNLNGLLKLNRDKLNAKAQEIGVEGAADLSSKREVAVAILDKQATNPAAPVAPTEPAAPADGGHAETLDHDDQAAIDATNEKAFGEGNERPTPPLGGPTETPGV